MRIRQAVILVGGRGTRLGELTQDTPKPLLMVRDRPFLAWLPDEVARHGFSRVLLVAGYLGHQIANEFDGGRYRGADVKVLVEDQPTGTAGALRFAEPHLDNVFLLMNGDTFFDINLLDLASSFGDSLVHVALRRASSGSRYGRVRLGGDYIIAFGSARPRGRRSDQWRRLYRSSRDRKAHRQRLPIARERHVPASATPSTAHRPPLRILLHRYRCTT